MLFSKSDINSDFKTKNSYSVLIMKTVIGAIRKNSKTLLKFCKNLHNVMAKDAPFHSTNFNLLQFIEFDSCFKNFL